MWDISCTGNHTFTAVVDEGGGDRKTFTPASHPSRYDLPLSPRSRSVSTLNSCETSVSASEGLQHMHQVLLHLTALSSRRDVRVTPYPLRERT